MVTRDISRVEPKTNTISLDFGDNAVEFQNVWNLDFF